MSFKNPNTFRIESSLGAVFISLLSMFFIGLLFISIKNFNSDVDIINGTYNNARVSKVSQTELVLIKDWVQDNKINIPEGRGYRYLIRKYPNKPWLE